MKIEDRIIEKLIGLDQKIEHIRIELASKPSRDEMMSSFDAQGVILQRLDQEYAFTSERINRIETDVDRVKTILHIA